MRLAPSRIIEVNEVVKPQLAAIYAESSSLFSTRGLKVTHRAIEKGTVGGEQGMRLLFEPALLLAFDGPPNALYEIAKVARGIPFAGNYGIWSPAGEVIAAAYRTLTKAGDERADAVEKWLSLPENNGVEGAPVLHQPMIGRLAGDLLVQFDRVSYHTPLKLPQFSFVIAKVGELCTMWAFGGSQTWPRPRIDEEIVEVKRQVADFLT